MLGETPGLAAWMAEPVDEALALNDLKRVQRHALHGGHGDQTVFTLRLGELILRYWAGKDIEAGYKNLLALLEGEREQSILELCIGQLLIARKLSRAWVHLDRGFQLGTHLLEPKDYFLVLKRHELLRQLPLRRVQCEPAGLDSLLAEARIIASLRGRGTPHGSRGPGHRDTVD
jgi:hypothetical protein